MFVNGCPYLAVVSKNARRADSVGRDGVTCRFAQPRRAIFAALLLWCTHPSLGSSQTWQSWQGMEWSSSERTRDVAWPLQTVLAGRNDLTNAVFIAAIGSAAGILVGGLVGSSIDAARDLPSVLG